MVKYDRLPRFDGAPPSLDNKRTVIRMNGVAGFPVLQFFNRIAEILDGLTIDKLNLAGSVHRGDEAGNAVDDQAQALLVRTKSLLRSLALVDVRQQVIPTYNATVVVPLRKTARLKPAVHTIGSTKTMLNIIRLAGFYSALPLRYDTVPIIRREKSRPVLQFINSSAEVVQHLLISEFNFACCIHCPNEARNRVDDLTKLLLARAYGCFSNLPVVNVGQQHIPVGDATIGVHRWKST